MINSFGDISSIAKDVDAFQDSEIRDIDRRLMILEEENKQLRNLGYFKSEVERLKLELNYANSLKHKYRNMYNEAAVKLMYLQNTDSMIFEEDDQIVNLNKKVELLMSANEDLKKNYDQAFALLNQERQENSRLVDEVIPQLEAQVKKTKTDRNPKDRSRSLCVQKVNATHVAAKNQISKPATAKPKPRANIVSGDDARKNASVGKNSAKGFYLPSFMRNKKTVRKDSKIDKKEE